MTLPDGNDAILPLVRVDLPSATAGYHYGGRDYEYNGLVYKASKFLEPVGLDLQTGPHIQSRELVFSNIPDTNDVIAQIENYQWKRGLVTLTWLRGELNSDVVSGVLHNEFYEIHALDPETSEEQDGIRYTTLTVTIGPRASRPRNSGHAMASNADQQLDNSATDTFMEYVGTQRLWTRKWGQR